MVKCKKISVRALHPAVGSSYKHPTQNAKFAIDNSIEILTTRPNPERFIYIYANPEKLMKFDTYIMHCVAVYLDKVGIVNRLLLNLFKRT